MIAADQPAIFGAAVTVGVSSAADGNMRDVGTLNKQTIHNYERFVRGLGADPTHTSYQLVSFEGTNYCRYHALDTGEDTLGISRPIFADAVSVDKPGHALFVPVADCTPAVLYDPVKGALMLSHLGRHSTEQEGAIRSVEFMAATYGCHPADILVWLGPSPNGDVYPIWARGNRSFREINTEDMLKAGITPDHLEVSPVDTAADHNYFSHSEFLKGHRATDGRFGVFAMIR